MGERITKWWQRNFALTTTAEWIVGQEGGNRVRFQQPFRWAVRENQMVTPQEKICRVERGRFPLPTEQVKNYAYCRFIKWQERNNTLCKNKWIFKAWPILSSLEAQFNSSNTGLPPILEDAAVTLKTATYKCCVRAHIAVYTHLIIQEKKPQFQ